MVCLWESVRMRACESVFSHTERRNKSLFGNLQFTIRIYIEQYEVWYTDGNDDDDAVAIESMQRTYHVANETFSRSYSCSRRFVFFSFIAFSLLFRFARFSYIFMPTRFRFGCRCVREEERKTGDGVDGCFESVLAFWSIRWRRCW